MKVDKKRIFISDLPETATEADITKAFESYGKVTSVEIKERKELGLRNKSLFFAYINIETDDRNLQRCFQDFANEKWHGQYVELQVARESFLERLKREREESGVSKNTVDNSRRVSELPEQNVNLLNGFKKRKLKQYKSSSESDGESDSSESENENKINKKNPIEVINDNKESKSFENDKEGEFQDIEVEGLVIKSNKGKTFDKSGLKIESVGKEPIIKIDKSKKKTVNTSEANLKRLQSLNNLKKGYQNQKSLVQAALSKIDNKSANKIIFDDHTETTNQSQRGKHQKQLLFDDNASEEEEFEPSFAIKEQFQGQKGQKLLELQSKYKNDKRFVLDQRFLDDGVEDNNKIVNVVEDNEEITLEDEKKKEYEILEQVLGKKVTPKYPQQNESRSQTKAMLRYDPTQPDHSKFEIQEEARPQKKKKRKRNESEVDILAEKKQEEREVPEVSKEIFYKVTDNLKESLQEKQEFSLLSMFGKADGEDKEQAIEESSKQLSGSSFTNERNPFRYDSTDDEDEPENIDEKEKQLEPEKPAQDVQNRSNRNSFWSEPFFFKTDDYRLQDGFDFIEKMKSDDKTEFSKIRRDLKEIVKAKVRNNQRKHKPFKKKLGGSKRKKMIRMKKALKR